MEYLPDDPNEEDPKVKEKTEQKYIKIKSKK